MKKTLLLTLVLVFAMSLSASAQVAVDGAYFNGTYEYSDIGATENGFILSLDADVAGPFGVMANFTSMELSDFEHNDVEIPDDVIDQSMSRFDILATYKFPVEGANLKVAAGYTCYYEDYSAYDGDDEWALDIDGGMIGLAGEFKPADKFTLSGFVGCGVGLTGSYEDGPEHDFSLTTLRLAGAYEVVPNVSVELGYLSDKWSNDDIDSDEWTNSGFFLGARASF